MNDFIDDFFQGQKDCQQGNPHEANKSDSYNRGYSTEYESAAIKDEMTKNDYRATKTAV